MKLKPVLIERRQRLIYKNFKKFILIVSFVLSVILPTTAQAQSEQILSFHSFIEIQSDSSLIITEIIKVQSLGHKIKRGIYRDFPTHYQKAGKKYTVGFKVLSVKKDNVDEAYHIKSVSNGKRIYIGRQNHFLQPGQYTYTIQYKTNKQLGFFADHDEIYWNVTGNGWDFPIKEVLATVYLPEGAQGQILDHKAYTGYQNSIENATTYSIDQEGNPYFITTRELKPREGLTIFVSFPKGYVVEGESDFNLEFFLAEYVNEMKLFGIVGLLLIYYVFAWFYIGKDPKKGTIIPLFHPPQGLSPAGLSYLLNMGFKKKAYSAAIINMAVKGYIKIEEKYEHNILDVLKIQKSYVLTKIGKDNKVLSVGERKIAYELFRYDTKFEMIQKNHKRIKESIDGLSEPLEAEMRRVYFYMNAGYAGVGWGLALVLGYIFLGIAETSSAGGFIIILSWALFLLIPLVGGHLLKAPTKKGRKLMDKVEGFKLYLTVAEKDRINLQNPPERTPEHFEKLLPYALALGVEKNWAGQFSDVLAQAAASGSAYSPSWYVGDAWDDNDLDGFTSNLGSSFSGAIASSSVAPGSSSGGGGFSGGGGGGGGGGGW